MALLNLNKKVDPFRIAFSDDNFIARIIISRKTKSESAINFEAICAELNKTSFNYSLSSKKLEDAYWEFLRSGDLEFKFSMFADELLMIVPHVMVVVSPDEMKASISINVPKEKRMLISLPLIHRILKNNKVQAGIDEEEINDIVKSIREGTGVINNRPIALGIPELRGEDGSLDLSAKFDQEIEIEQKSKEQVKKTLPAKVTPFTVIPREVLVTVYPAQKGKEGRKVTGETIWSDTNTKTVRTPSVTVSRGVEEKVYPHKIEYRSTVNGRAFFINNSIIDVEIALDGVFSLEISRDKLTCHLSLKAPQGGKPISMKEIKQELSDRKISAPVDDAAIEREITRLNELDDSSTNRLLIAEGTSPVNGMDEKINWNISVDKVYLPDIDTHGNIDFKQSNSLPIIRKDENVGTLFPATNGEKAGIDIFGNEVKPTDGREFGMEIAELFEFIEGYEEERTCQYLKAKISGLFQVRGNNIQVLPVFEAKTVDYSTGNINFDGHVLIKETVADGFSVKATKEIIINGNIGACRIESSENVIIKGGINGRKKGLVKSNKNVICKYAENCSVYAKEKIIIEKHALISRLISNGEILIGKANKGGKILGCHLFAENKISTNYVGAETSTDSLLWAGINKPVYDRLVKAQDELAVIAGKLMEKKMVREIDLSPSELEEHYGAVRALEKEKEEIQKKIETYSEIAFPFETAEIDILNDIQDHTMIKIGEMEYPLVSGKSKIRMRVEKGKIIAESLIKKK